MAGRQIPKDKLEAARQILADPDATYTAASAATGISTDTLARRFPRDRRPGARPAPAPAGPQFEEPAQAPPPRGRDPRPAAAKSKTRKRTDRIGKPTDEELENLLRKVAKAPAIPMKVLARCDVCSTHFIDTAPEVASEMMALAQDEPDLREALEWIWREWRKLAWASALGAWIGFPVAHHLAPERFYPLLVLFAGMPPRGTTSSQDAHAHRASPANGTSATAAPIVEPTQAAPGPFADMTLSEMLDTAQAAGINLKDFGITDEMVADIMVPTNGIGYQLTVMDIINAEADEDQGHGDAGTPEEFIEPDPEALDDTLEHALAVPETDTDPTDAPGAQTATADQDPD